ncbi:hypothetical protein I3842_16G106500 [Carya illinoinensis]|uniref:Disease resistance protein RPS4B/Roq1-like leucine-rich repeats domain-containing protein n=1 Tax=Carya illinoinensis TaxID=32201 RepID=A0A922D1C6_CARIL|nr:hypothetical protein I3842_16G106500 [Carya illinoinensis]
MPNLRVLINCNALFSEPPSYFSNELRVLDFKNYHGTSLPSNFNGKNLVDLRMTMCKLKSLGNKFKNFQNLKCLDLEKCDFLKRIPDTSRLPNLENLYISKCNRLVEVDQSIGSHCKLVRLSIHKCPKLNSFPSSLNMRSLESLYVHAGVSLVSFPEIGLEMKCLIWIKWSSTSIKELPHSIGNLTELQYLHLESNKNLAHIPSSICQLENLSHLDLIGCTKRITYPKLDSLTFTNWFSKVTKLKLPWGTFVILPGLMDRFVGLRELSLYGCDKLKKIEKLPPNIEVVKARYCSSLESFPDISKRFEFNTSNLSKLHSIDLYGCSKMLVNVGSHVAAILRPEEAGFGKSSGLLFPGNKIPNWFSNCKETSNSCSSDIFIEVELLNPSVIKGILTCAVFNARRNVICSSIQVNYDGRCLGTIFYTYFFLADSNPHVWLASYDLKPFTLAKGSLQICFKCDSGGILFKHCGVHLVRKDEKNAKRKRDDDDEKYYSMDDNLEDGDED